MPPENNQPTERPAPPTPHAPRARLSRRLLAVLLWLQILIGTGLVLALTLPPPDSHGVMRGLAVLLFSLSIPPAVFFLWFLTRAQSTQYRPTQVTVLRAVAIFFYLAQTVLFTFALWNFAAANRDPNQIQLSPEVLPTTAVLAGLAACTFLSLIAVCTYNPWGRANRQTPPLRPDDSPTHLESHSTGDWDHAKPPRT